MKFSQRIGITSFEKAIQIGSVDDELRNSLWSLLSLFYWDKFDKRMYDRMGGSRRDYISRSNLDDLFTALWLHYFKKPTDTIPALYYGEQDGLGVLRSYYFSANWYEIYDFVEFVSVFGPNEQKEYFVKACNSYLERENSGYRFVDGKIIEISSPDEIDEIENALRASIPYYGVKQHLSSAIILLKEKNNPDYRNSIKESISVVESLCKKISENEQSTLGEALKVMENKGVLHPALKSAFSALYGYTNDANGIRHALLKESNLTRADAPFMLISCSAFINYVISNIETDA